MIGTLILFLGWLFFNGGRAFSMFEHRANDPAKIIQNTYICPAVAGIVAIILKPLLMRKGCNPFVALDCKTLCNGVLVGLVSISGACDRCEPWAAVIIGYFAGVFYAVTCKILQSCGIDDPCESTPIYLIGGIWGLLAIAFLDN